MRMVNQFKVNPDMDPSKGIHEVCVPLPLNRYVILLNPTKSEALFPSKVKASVKSNNSDNQTSKM